MARHNRWAYLGRPEHTLPNTDCPECTEPSKTFHKGARTKEGVTTKRYGCENDHEWRVNESEEDAAE